ncbi:MAG: hypothetical protein ABIN24_15555, partial [Dyadobacter sp.]
GGDHEGLRLNRMYKESLDETAILNELDEWFGKFIKERTGKERFGDYSFRKLAPPQASEKRGMYLQHSGNITTSE